MSNASPTIKKEILLLMPDSLEKAMGGMGEQCRQILSHWNNPNIHFQVIGSQMQPPCVAEKYTYSPLEFNRLPTMQVDPLNLIFLNQTGLLYTALKRTTKPDIVHAFDWSTAYAGVHLAAFYNVPFVMTVQLSIELLKESLTVPINPQQELGFHTACGIEMNGLLSAARIIQVSHSYAKQFPKILQDKTTVIENGIDLQNWTPKQKFVFPGQNQKKLIYIGRYAEMKNVRALFAADIPDNVDLIYIGKPDGGDATNFDDMLGTCSAPNRFYIGPLFGQEKIDALCAADAVIIPSTHEPFGIVALEALASKSVLLSSFVDGMGDFLNNKCAINCGTTPSSIENAISHWLSLSPIAETEMHQEGLALCQKYTWDKATSKLNDIYCSLF